MYSSETSLLLLTGSSNVGLGVLAGETLSTEMMDGLSVLGSSKEEGVGSYYNFILDLATNIDSRRGCVAGWGNLPEGVCIMS